MLSICIATYNYDVRELVREVHKQCRKAAVPFEILVADDHSELHVHERNQSCAATPQVLYWRESENRGRAAIRNILARRAQFSYLLFLDCDAQITSPHFIKDYVAAAHKHCVICGGVDYQKKAPERAKFLRWNYGVQREKISAEVRTKTGKGLTLFNLLIDRELFLRIRLNEIIREYGYEDTLLEYTLKQQKAHIIHINNAAIHAGLDTNAVFLHKIEESLRTVTLLVRNADIERDFLRSITIYRTYMLCKKIHVVTLLKLIFRTIGKPLYRAIVQKNLPLQLFDFYKLAYFCSIQTKHS
ncbi:MAG: glycosyltransferase [Bacteroidales bacterium]|jgi:glycosyltransferase involved in cell wall biosynthesis|nr:glycosyltransferase [Bacteroidales bacterium]